MNAATLPSVPLTSAPPAPSLWRVTRARLRDELRSFFREPAAVGFTLLFPVVMLVLFGSIFSEQMEHTGVSVSQLYVAGILGSSLMSVGFTSLAIGVAVEREQGMLKRLAGTPMPKAAYFLAKIGRVWIIGVLEVAILLAVGVTMFQLSLPTDPERWLTFVWVFGLGSAAATLLGLAVGGMIRSAKAAPAILNVPFVVLQFISGVFLPEKLLPEGVRAVASALPLRWMCKGMRSVFLPDSFLSVEAGRSWQHGLMALMLIGWCVVGALLTMRTFHWVERER
jgi:ABC-2 type transport system permease protein